MALPVQVHRADDPLAGDVSHPDVAVLTTGSVEARSIRREHDTEKSRVHLQSVDQRMCTFQIADQSDRERPDAAVYGGERVAIFRNRQPERLGSADAKFLPDGRDG